MFYLWKDSSSNDSNQWIDFELEAMSFGIAKFEGIHIVEPLSKSVEDKGGLTQQWELKRFKRVYTTDSFSVNIKDLEHSKSN